MSSCLDGDPMNLPPGASPPIIEMSYVSPGGTLMNTGLQYFGAQTLLLAPDKAEEVRTFAVTIQPAFSKDINVTLSVAPDAADDNFANDKINYSVMSDDQFDFVTESATIKAGQTYAEFQVKFYPPKINFKQDLILPITFSNDQNILMAANRSITYFHIIGNDLSGIYTVTGKRRNYSKTVAWDGTIGTYPTPVATVTSPSPKVAVPNSKTQVALDYANLGSSGYHYIIDYDPAGPSIDVTGDFLTNVSNFKVWAKTISFDPTTKKATIRIVTTYNNQPDGSGDDRIIDETFVQQ